MANLAIYRYKMLRNANTQYYVNDKLACNHSVTISHQIIEIITKILL